MKKLINLLFFKYHDGSHFVKEANRFYVSCRIGIASITLALILALIFRDRASIACAILYSVSGIFLCYAAFLYFRYEKFWRLDDKK